MAASMVGTVRGHAACGRCGHSRIRHTTGPHHRCAGINWVPRDTGDGLGSIRATICGCPGFIEPTERI